MVMFVQARSIIVVSQECYETKCKVNCKTTKTMPCSFFYFALTAKSLRLIKCCLVKMCEGLEVVLYIFNVNGCFHILATSLQVYVCLCGCARACVHVRVQGRGEPLVYFL